MNDAFIYDALRTPRGKARDSGGLHAQRPIDLVTAVMHAAATRNDIDPSKIDDVILGCVTQTGEQGANLAKIAALYAGWGESVPGVTVNRFCTSGLDAIIHGVMQVKTGAAQRIAAGGVESMSRVPMFSDKGAWFADPEVATATRFLHMGLAADLLATRATIDRSTLDQWAATSHARAAHARAKSRFARAIVPVAGLDHDELVRPDTTSEALAQLPAAFDKLERPPWLAETIEHRHSIATSPGMCDAASLVLIGDRQAFVGCVPRARVVAWATVSVDPVVMLTGNVDASRKALARAGLTASEVDSWEINESFAAVPIHFVRELDVNVDRVNPNGGALAMGHPLGATGGVLVATLLDELERRAGRYGVVSICGGAGVATAVVIERCPA